MSLLGAKEASLVDDGGEPYERPPLDTPAFMSGGEGVTESVGASGLDAHDDARALVRVVQCPQCSLPFRLPVTLPCGHTFCRQCLPQPHRRENISYPATPDRQDGITCPGNRCGREHPVVECNVDVTLTKVFEAVDGVLSKHRPDTEDTPTQLKETLRDDDLMDIVGEKEKPRLGRTAILQGGRLVSTFTFAQRGELHLNADVEYQSLSPDGDDYRELDRAVLNRIRETAQKEVDCHICYNMMCDPVTTPCGHTFCRRCLIRVMDHSTLCPVCRRTLTIPPSLRGHPSNTVLNNLLSSLCHEAVAVRRDMTAEEERGQVGELDTPLFVCTLSFPTVPTFLHIFEPRYRLMVRRALESNRQFGMLMYNQTRSPQGDLGPTPFLEYGTMLQIINIQMLPDGRSLVETRGAHRFRVRAHGILDGYTVGRVERVGDISLADEERLEAEEMTNAAASREDAPPPDNGPPGGMAIPEDLSILSTQQMLDIGIAFVAKMRAHSASWLHRRIIDAYGEPPNDPALFPYWLANVLPIADDEKYHLLPTTSVRERLKIVVGWIQRIERQRWHGGACIIL